ncbi:hypothetical protein G7Y89_g10521 [Cudoniella acicularis]|uniref:DNA repair protein RAD5 n=1 Tax=Cudoniella acicularis TaxID=354080 RepID=A0A8H4RFD3_9HELO|nr:hypothetical protein G7Y89_g10521 [Cudoniella acicularis]
MPVHYMVCYITQVHLNRTRFTIFFASLYFPHNASDHEEVSQAISPEQQEEPLPMEEEILIEKENSNGERNTEGIHIKSESSPSPNLADSVVKGDMPINAEAQSPEPIQYSQNFHHEMWIQDKGGLEDHAMADIEEPDVESGTGFDDNLFVDGGVIPELPSVQSPQESQPRRQRKSAPRARNARDHVRLHLPASKREQLTRKKGDLAKLRRTLEGRVSKFKSRKQAKSSPSPNSAAGLLRPRKRITKVGGAGALDISSKNVGDLIKKFTKYMQEHPDLDLHRCISTDANGLIKKARSWGLYQMKPNDLGWKLNGMESTLRHHQLIGAHFMLERECAQEAPTGGICADVMGLGKTVQILAIIQGNPPAKEHIDKNQKATLVVGPSSIKSQWYSEIWRHTPQLYETTTIYQSSAADNTLTKLTNSAIVLTTYWELFNSMPSPPKALIDAWKADKNVDEWGELERWTAEHMEEAGLLHQVDWYRIVLDEGPYESGSLLFERRASVDHERTVFISFRIDEASLLKYFTEFYPLLRFIKEPITMGMHPNDFEIQFCNADDTECSDGLGILLRDLLFRRTMDDQLFGGPIVVLPNKHQQVSEVKAHEAEIILTRAIMTQFCHLRQISLKKGDPRYKLKHLFAQLTRLRQGVGSFDIIGLQIMVMFELDDLKTIQNLLRPLKVPGSPRAFPNMLLRRFATWIEQKSSGEYKKYLTAEDDSKCEICAEESEDMATLKKCRHTFCEVCLEREIRNAYIEDGEMGACPKCDEPFDPVKHVKYYGKGRSLKASKLWRGKDSRGFRTSLGPNQAYAQYLLDKYDSGELEEFLPSTKVDSDMKKYMEWLSEAPDDKIIVFSQFRFLSIILGIRFEKEKVGFIYFSGDMSHKQRDKAVELFRTNNNIKVMIAGLKCGGLGLNLTCANRVGIVDQWWNRCTEDQANGRVYRLGQDKETYLGKTVVQETIDERLWKIQKKKAEIVSDVMQDGLTTEDWAELLDIAPEHRVEGLLDIAELEINANIEAFDIP